MLKCVDRIRNKSGVITAYVIDDGTQMTPDALKAALQKNGNGFISNLTLASDGRILLKKEANKSDVGDDNLKKMHLILAKRYKASLQDLETCVKYMAKYLGLKVKKLSDNYYLMGPYYVYIDYKFSDSKKLLEVYKKYQSDTTTGLPQWQFTTDFLKYLEENKPVALWTIGVYYGNQILPDCRFLRLTNARYAGGVTPSKYTKLTLNSDKAKECYIFDKSKPGFDVLLNETMAYNEKCIGYDNLIDLGVLRNELGKVRLEATRLFNAYEAIDKIGEVVKRHFTTDKLRVEIKHNCISNTGSNIGRVTSYISVLPVRENLYRETYPYVQLQIYNFEDGKADSHYRMETHILNSSKQDEFMKLVVGDNLKKFLASIDANILNYIRQAKKDNTIQFKSRKEMLNCMGEVFEYGIRDWRN